MSNHLHRRSSGFRFHPAAVLFCTATLLLSPKPLFGEVANGRKVVRIAYQEFNRQMVVDERNHPVSGYAYDYIQTIGIYAGWNVEFVSCDSFADSVRMLLAGEVDLAYELSYTEERAKSILFPDEPMGYEYYYLYASGDNASILPGDIASLSGKTVGVTSGTVLADFLKQWSEEKGVEFEIVEFEDIPDKEAALFAREIDFDLEVSMLAHRNLSAVEKIGASAYYLAARKDRPDLVDDINRAMEKVLNNDPFYFLRLQERYFSDTVLSRNLTVEERNWLADHKVLRVGYFDDYLPFSAMDKDGNPAGAGMEVIKGIVAQLKLEDALRIEFIRFDDQEDGYRAVESGAVDLMFPAYISDSVKQDYRIVGGKIIASLSVDLAYVDDFEDGQIGRLGVNRNNLMQHYYCKDCYPDSEIVLYDNIRGCLDGLLDGTSDGTFLNGFRSDSLLKPGRYHPIRTVRAKNDFPFRMAFAEDNIGLMMLMDRGLTLLEPDFVNNAVYSNLRQVYTESLSDFLQRHLLSTIVSIAVLVALLVALIGYRISNRKLAKINRELTVYSETIAKQSRNESELRKQLEAALKLAQSANRAKTAFLSNMSHDIRTPMNAIVGFAGFAADHVGDTERVRDCLAAIERSSEHLLALINDILDMSRIESGKLSLHEKPESLPEILRDLQAVVRPGVQAKGLHFSIEATDVRNEFVHCDKMRLTQVLLNLVSNAVKYTNPGGTVSLRVLQKPSSGADRAAFEFRCKDNGIGMSEEFARTIFDPFTREESSTVSGIQGTGLGMAITKNVVDLMGGRISVSSKKGEGSEFVVEVDFRIADGKSSPRTNREKRGALLKGKNVLLVDDNAVNLQIGMLQLRGQGMTVDTAPSGGIAIDRIREKGVDAYDFVLMDVQMPVMDGYEATSKIRALPGGDRLKIVAYSANAFEEDREKSLQAGMNGHIAKPLKIDELMDELERIVA